MIEILIVIAIIGILAAILIPNLMSARNRANNASTMSYLRAVTIKQTDYHIDNSSYAAAESVLGLIRRNPEVVIESWTGDVSDFCVQAKHSRGKVFKVTANGRVSEGTCI